MNSKYIFNKAYKTIYDYRYHKVHAIQAAKVLKGIELGIGKTKKDDIRLCDIYAMDVFGAKHFAPWLYVYSAMAGEFKEGWIPDNYYGNVVSPKVNGAYGRIAPLKPLNSILFENDLFPDLGCYVNGLFFDNKNRIISELDLKRTLFDSDEKIAFKVDSSFQGKGVYFYTIENFDLNAIKRLGNGVFQSYIKQHSGLADFAQGSVATLRLTTVVEDSGNISLRGCYIRFGRGEDTHVASNSHIRVPIDLNNGNLSEFGYLTNWLATHEHPDSKIEFKGAEIPDFFKCVSSVIELHRKIPFSRCIGWDVAIGKNGKIYIMEWNARHNDIKFSEATQGPCFRDLNWHELLQK